ncbi:biopolymer transporter ExbD [Candidatus Albibeggiatoa sp. nov. NOAA]|uniref:ExbD/TolR family protein n=1 Tax=Candidatus Albibeggiatoa sp. nov. NOAA TaxID=3162724 RepID=UPI0032F99F75|nr:biopolymer transporter ExbD [Thiotrichaceae bacterium]
MKFRRHRTEASSLRLNLTPLIDTVFLLLIFFMMTTTFNRQSELQIQLPETETEQAPEQEVQPIRILINKKGDMAINSWETALVNDTLQTITMALEKAAGTEENPSLLISADAYAPHQSVMRALEAAQTLGYNRIGFEAEQPSQ